MSFYYYDRYQYCDEPSWEHIVGFFLWVAVIMLVLAVMLRVPIFWLGLALQQVGIGVGWLMRQIGAGLEWLMQRAGAGLMALNDATASLSTMHDNLGHQVYSFRWSALSRREKIVRALVLAIVLRIVYKGMQIMECPKN